MTMQWAEADFWQRSLMEGGSKEMQFGGVRFSDFMKHYQVGKKADGTCYQYVGLENSG
ncbi:MAG: hypothetical protein NDI69_12890 [Bacteriovoracaceae bacterium]|nr:hypothetical protein [Bacteriovoracaceae bacterium]